MFDHRKSCNFKQDNLHCKVCNRPGCKSCIYSRNLNDNIDDIGKCVICSSAYQWTEETIQLYKPNEVKIKKTNIISGGSVTHQVEVVKGGD